MPESDKRKGEIKRLRGEYAPLQKDEAMYRDMVESANSIILRMDPDGIITYFNKFAQNYFGYSEDEILGRNVVGTIIPETDNSGRSKAAMIKDIISDAESYAHSEQENTNKNGERVWVAWSNKPIRDQKGLIAEFLCIGNDITEYKHTEKVLQKSEEKYRTLVDNLNVGIYRSTLDPLGRFLEANPAIAQMFGYEAVEEFKNTSISDLSQNPREWESLISEILINGFVKNKELLLKMKDGTPIYISCSAQAKFNNSRKIEWIDGMLEDITERKLAEELFWQKAIHDLLSGLLNRRYFMEQFSSAIHAAKRYGYPLSLCLCDLDKFKAVNDNYGHRIGDEVISTFGIIVKEELRKEDVGGRYGGDEFCIFFPHNSPSGAVKGVERIRKRFQEAIFKDEQGTSFSISASFGITELSIRDDNEKHLINSADAALYKAKNIGGNRVIVNNGKNKNC